MIWSEQVRQSLEGMQNLNLILGKRRLCQLCVSIDRTFTFPSHNTTKTFNIMNGPLHCNSKIAFYSFNVRYAVNNIEEAQ